MTKYILYFILIFGLNIYVQAQEVNKLLHQADQMFQAGLYYQAIPLYREALMYDNVYKAKEQLANCYRLSNMHKDAAYWYNFVVEQGNNSENEFYYAQSLHSLGKYAEAWKWYNKYAETHPQVKPLADACKNPEQFRKTEQDFTTIPFALNTPKDDIGVSYYADGLFFASAGINNKKTDAAGFLDIYFVKEIGKGAFSPPFKVKGLNSSRHDGPATVGVGGQQIWFTRNQNVSGKNEVKNRFDTYYVTSPGSGFKFSKAIPFILNNPEYSVMHPTVSNDGTTIFFVSDMPGGYGGKDVYVIYRAGDTWSEPMNLGAEVNTSGDELFPFYHESGELYFSSNLQPGLGGYDIFVTKRNGNTWEKPTNIGAPFNTFADDVAFSCDKAKNVFFVSSKREGGLGAWDIYRIDRKVPQPYVPTKVIDPGIYAVNNDTGKKQSAEPIVLNTSLNLQPVRFEFKKATLQPQSYAAVDKVIAYLKKHPQDDITIESHTDARGAALLNLEVSQARAIFLRDYFMQNGISADRIKSVGYGANLLLNQCKEGVNCSEEQHAVNDRVVFKIEQVVSASNSNPDEIEFINPSNNKVKIDKKKDLAKKDKQVKKTKSSAKTKKQASAKPKKEPKPKKEKPKKAAKSAKTPKSKSSPIKEQPREIIPKVATTDKTIGFTFRVNVGPYTPPPDPLLINKIEKLNITPKLSREGKNGEIIHIGMFDSIFASEQVEAYLKQAGFKKVEIEVFSNGTPSKLSIKQLKKDGVY